MDKELAMKRFALLVRQYGLKWTSSVPAAAWEELNAINAVLTESDRRHALGLR